MFDIEDFLNQLRTFRQRRGFLGAATGDDLMEQRQPFLRGAHPPPRFFLMEDDDPNAVRPVTRSITGRRPSVWPPGAPPW